jgi:hypothetical protein
MSTEIHCDGCGDSIGLALVAVSGLRKVPVGSDNGVRLRKSPFDLCFTCSDVAFSALKAAEQK